MAFTGTPAQTKIANAHHIIKDVTLAAGASGTIGNDGGAGEVSLPAGANTIDANWEVIVMGDELCRTSITGAVVTITNGDGSNASESLVIHLIDPFFRTGK